LGVRLLAVDGRCCRRGSTQGPGTRQDQDSLCRDNKAAITVDAPAT
jgi:hypothetical protein